MNEHFVITKINRIILVDKDEYQEAITTFTHELKSQELIFHLSGEATIYFNGSKLETKENTDLILEKIHFKNPNHIRESESLEITNPIANRLSGFIISFKGSPLRGELARSA